jgi:hypothetical protein
VPVTVPTRRAPPRPAHFLYGHRKQPAFSASTCSGTPSALKAAAKVRTDLGGAWGGVEGVELMAAHLARKPSGTAGQARLQVFSADRPPQTSTPNTVLPQNLQACGFAVRWGLPRRPALTAGKPRRIQRSQRAPLAPPPARLAGPCLHEMGGEGGEQAHIVCRWSPRLGLHSMASPGHAALARAVSAAREGAAGGRLGSSPLALVYVVADDEEESVLGAEGL